jgi:peptidoglycan DL-endopeptidase LytF
MEFSYGHQIRKIERTDDEYEMIVYLDDDLTEFAQELGTNPKERMDFVSSVKEMVKNRYPKLKVNVVKVMIGGLAIMTIPLMGANETPAQAAETSPTTTQASVDSSLFYYVSTGDTLYSIANKFQTSVDAVKRANGLQTNFLQINQRLVIPKAFHTVASLDTLYSIAKQHGTSVDALKTVNGLTSNVISLGQSLVIPNIMEGNPALPVTENQTTTYTVVAGDSLWTIANRHNITVNALKSVNNLTTDILSVGQSLTIPTSNSTPDATTEIPTTSNLQYKVVSGDTLWSVANRYKVSLDALRSSNNLDNDTLTIGQTLIIPKESGGVTAPALTPATNSTNVSYTVVSGDTLSGIARKYNVTVDQIKKTNQLSSDFLRVGQTLSIPGATTVNTQPTEPASATELSLQVVQENLQKLGYYAVTTMTGSYDNNTKQAISNFQKDYGLSVTGNADSTTTTAIEHAVVKQNLIKDSNNYLGVPYLWGGTSPSGFDCSGFVYFMFNKHGVDMSRNTSAGLYKTGTSVDRGDLQPGDLVFFAVNTSGTISHVGFYMGDNQFISATSSKGIAAVSMDNSYWSKYYVGAKRVF